MCVSVGIYISKSMLHMYVLIYCTCPKPQHLVSNVAWSCLNTVHPIIISATTRTRVTAFDGRVHTVSQPSPSVRPFECDGYSRSIFLPLLPSFPPNPTKKKKRLEKSSKILQKEHCSSKNSTSIWLVSQVEGELWRRRKRQNQIQARGTFSAFFQRFWVFSSPTLPVLHKTLLSILLLLVILPIGNIASNSTRCWIDFSDLSDRSEKSPTQNV